MKKAMKYLVGRPAAALFFDPGMRKTSITLGAFKALRKAGVVRRMLVVAPLKPAYLVWPYEIQKWLDFCDLKCVVLHGAKKEKALAEPADVYIVNYDGLEWLSQEGRLEALNCEVLVFDELSKTKHHGTKRFKLLKKIIVKFKYRWGLTGSPAANGLLGLFGQLYVLDRGKTLGQFYTHYRAKFFTPVDPMGYKWVPREGAKDLIYAQIAPTALRADARDYLDLPPLLEVPVVVELPPEARRLYDELEEHLITRLSEDEVFTAANAGAASTKCQQLAGGALYADDEPTLVRRAGQRPWHEVHGAKIDALADLVDELQGAPLLVGYLFDHEADRIQQRLGALPTLRGGMSPSQAQAIVDAWNRGELPILLGQVSAMSHGLNLQDGGCSRLCLFTAPWDYEQYDQLIRRILRSGTTAVRILLYQLIAKDTIDEVKYGALRAKERGQNAFFSALKEYAKNRRLL